jgi:C4-dicarboxylate-specific signal transduction histidine kinase
VSGSPPVPNETIECPLCLGEGNLKRTEILDRLGVKDFARVATLSAEEAFRLLSKQHTNDHQSAWARFDTELTQRTAQIEQRHRNELQTLGDRINELESAARVAEELHALDVQLGHAAVEFVRVRRKNGTEFPVEISLSPLETAEGTLVSGAVRDLTERTRAEEALRQAKADLTHVSRVTTMGELTASLAHEIKQPIAAAVTDANTCLRWLGRDQPDLAEAREAASRIIKDATRAADIISRVRLLFEKGTPQQELVDVNEVIQEMIVLLRGEATAYSISVRTELAEDLPRVMGDRMQLQQVLMNLMMNSIDAMKNVDGTREITIQSQRAENGQVLISVSDTGVGLPPEKAEQIFDAFFTTKPHGTGMGLRISRSIIESHGGRLWAANNSPRDARFAFTLPTKIEGSE